MQQVSLIDGTLFLDGVPIVEGQILRVKWRDGREPLCGRAYLSMKDHFWYLDCEEFLGMPYLNITLSPETLSDMIVTAVGESPGGRT